MDGGSKKTFWYTTLDLVHYARVNLESPVRGHIVVGPGDWAMCFYKTPRTRAADRAWERWKVKARQVGILCALPGEVAHHVWSTRPRECVVMMRARDVDDVVYLNLGPPHPGGLFSQMECDKRARATLPSVVARGIAAAVLVERRRRLVG